MGSPVMAPMDKDSRGTHAHAHEPSARPFSVGDSSDDELPEPMKFSALTKALLEGEASAIGGSPPTVASDRSHRSAGSVKEGDQQASTRHLPIRRTQTSPDRDSQGSPHGRRVVRLSNGSGGSTTLRRSVSATDTNSPAVGNQLSRAVSPQDFITPAARTRSIYGRSVGARSGPSSGDSVNHQHAEVDGMQNEAQHTGLPATLNRSQTFNGQESALRVGSSTTVRHRYGEDTGVQGSLRIKRVGKVAGSFLSGPARRGRRRQSEEDQSPDQEHEGGLLDGRYAESEYDNNKYHSREGEMEAEVGMRGAPSEHASTEPASRDGGHHVRFATGSPSSEPANNIRLASISPEEQHDVDARNLTPPMVSSGSNNNNNNNNNKPTVPNPRPIFKVPPPPPSLPSRHDQENEAPPTFKRNKSTASALQSIIESVSVSAPDKPRIRPSATTSESPQRDALAIRSQNTPRRPAPPPPKMSVLETATATAGASTTSQSRKKRSHISINGKVFARLSCLGRGGSSRVYRVMAENDKVFALKRVTLEDVDEVTVRGYKGEIDLLKKLEHVERVVKLYDWEINEAKQHLSMLMECGETDFRKLLDSRLKVENARFDISFARYYWKEMLECVQSVHDHGIVHTDLKPANFLLVEGRLRLIDFGIASAIQDNTVNIHREHMVGTPNYLSPEATQDTNAAHHYLGAAPPTHNTKLMKLGKPSDVWSLGCILYQMVYGEPPFNYIPKQLQRIQAIADETHVINFPEVGLGDIPVPVGLLRTLKACLTRDPSRRPTIPVLLSETDSFLYPDAEREDVVQITQEVLGRILVNVIAHCRSQGIPNDAELSNWPKAFLGRIKKAQREEGLGLG
ncbi:MAG: hypothetical protein M1823_001908 [Watsoniomyces obsoletus]|nr:MAG: hypothetical protein M1823_001908 [Watsoniomyces obsoletus]